MSKVPESHALVLSLFFDVTRGFPGSSHHGSVEVNRTSIQEDTGSIPALAQEVKALAWPRAVVCGSQGWPVPGLAASVVYAGGYSSHSAPSLGTSLCRWVWPLQNKTG